MQIYEVELNKEISDIQVKQLSSGVYITTTLQRDKRSKPVTAMTLPCKVKRISGVNNDRYSYIQ